MRDVLVVGAGLAGLRAAEALREQGHDGGLTLIGDERWPPYTRPPLSKQLLAGEQEPEDCLFDCDRLDALVMLGQRATALDRERSVVTLSDGEEVPYDGLVVATGRRARQWPNLPPLAGFHTLRTLDDAVALRADVRRARPVAIVGAGFIGCEVAATLRRRGVEQVTLIDIAPQPMPVLGPELGRRAAELHEQMGVDLRLGVGVKGFDGEGRVSALKLSDGSRVEAELVLFALGSVPNTEWLAASGPELLEGALLCGSDCLAVGDERIAGAGDVAAWEHPRAGGRAVCVEHWTNAREMARAAAANLLASPDQRAPFAPVPSFWSDQYNASIKSAGLLGPSDRVSIVEDEPRERRLIVERHREERLVAAITLNRNGSFVKYKRRLAEER